MPVADQLKILDRQIKQNEAKYDLARKAAKISALSSGHFDKYEYLTGACLDYKPSAAENKDLSILYWVKFLIRDWIKTVKKKDF